MAELTAPYGTKIAFVAISTVIIITPILRYVGAGWATKRDDIMNSIDDNAKKIYLEKFEKYQAPNNAIAKFRFERVYHSRFGRRYFIVPTLLLFVLVILEASLCVESITGDYLWVKSLELNLTGISAVAGAYLWVVG